MVKSEMERLYCGSKESELVVYSPYRGKAVRTMLPIINLHKNQTTPALCQSPVCALEVIRIESSYHYFLNALFRPFKRR